MLTNLRVLNLRGNDVTKKGVEMLRIFASSQVLACWAEQSLIQASIKSELSQLREKPLYMYT